MTRPVMVAVGGDSGTGKSTLAAGLEAIFGAQQLSEICLDDYHALDRAQRKAVDLTALNPRANDFASMEQDLWQVAQGRAIEKPVYDHTDGTFGPRETLEPAEIVIVHGLFPLYTRALRAVFDVSVWLAPQTELKVAWKVQRDVSRRGYGEDDVRAEIAKRQPDIDAYVAPQERHADLCVTFSRPRPDTDNAKLDARILNGPHPRTIIEFDGDIDDETAATVQGEILRHMGTRHVDGRAEGVGLFADVHGTRVSHVLAIAQLLIAQRICLVLDELACAAAA